MALSDFAQFPKGLAENNVLHLRRRAEVILVKRLRNFLVPGANEPQTEYEKFREEYFEFLSGRALFRSAKALDAKWSNPDDSSKTLYRHFYIAATSQVASLSALLVDNVDSEKGNADVVSITATNSVEGRGGCVVVLNSRESRYIFQQNPFKKGQTVFESNDLIFVNLPGLDDKPHRTFTGLVTTSKVEARLGDTLQTSVVLECEDMLKLMAQSRTAVKPSVSPNFSGGKVFQGFAPDYSGKLPHAILTEILSRAYCDLYTSPGFQETLASIRTNDGFGTDSVSEVTEAVIKEEAEISSRLEVPKPSSVLATNPAYPFMAVVAQDGGATAPTGVLTPFTTGPEALTIPARIYGFRRMVASQTLLPKAPILAMRAGLPINVADPDDLAFIIDGTTQPATKLAFAQATSLYFADWQSGLGVGKKIAEDINYEFFADEDGVVRFRPLNVSLPHDFKVGQRRLPTDQLANVGKVGIEYWLEEKLISGMPTFVDTDSNVYTIAYCSSDWQIGSAPGAPPYKGSAIDLVKFLRLGPRTAPLIQKMQLNSDEACDAYATAHLARLNGVASTANIQYIGDSRIRVGNPCYVPHRNTIYYITSVTHHFVAGQGYTTTLTLSYGRRPIAVADPVALGDVTKPSLQNLLAFKSFEEVISDLKVQDRATPLIGAVSGGSTLADYIRTNKSNLTFQGYVWEPIMPLKYEQLFTGLAEARDFGIRKDILENFFFGSPAFWDEVTRVKQASALLPITTAAAVDIAAKNLIAKQGTFSLDISTGTITGTISGL